MKLISYSEETKKAILEINGEQRELTAMKSFDGSNITIFGIAVHYRTGKMNHPGHMTYWFESGRFNNVVGPNDHIRRHHDLQVVGFYGGAL